MSTASENRGSGPSFCFETLMPPAMQEQLAAVEQWRWVHTLPFPSEPPLRKGVAPLSLHSPAHREIMFMLEGSDTFALADKLYERRPGTIFLFDHHESRTKKARRPTHPYAALWLHLRDRQLITYNTTATDERGNHFRRINMRLKGGELPRLIMDAWDQCRHSPQEIMCWALLKSLTTTVLLEILGTATPIPPSNQHEVVIASIQNYIASHLAGELDLHTLSHLAGYSPYFFHRLFLKHVGQPLAQYVTRLRLERSRELLKAGYKLDAIAAEIGMASAYSFSRFFKNQSGISPRRWAQHHNDKQPSVPGKK